jgi:hypothetical protein
MHPEPPWFITVLTYKVQAFKLCEPQEVCLEAFPHIPMGRNEWSIVDINSLLSSMYYHINPPNEKGLSVFRAFSEPWPRVFGVRASGSDA